MKKCANNYFSNDLKDLLSDIREVGIGNVISDCMRGFQRWNNDKEMSLSYAMDYLLAEILENRPDYNRLYLWTLFVACFRQFYGTQG